MTTRIADGTGVLMSMPGVGVLHIVGTAADMPGDGEVGYAHGCIFQVIDTSGADTGIYTNIGTSASCNFDSIEVAGGATDATTLAGVTPTAAGLALLDDANAAAQRTTLGLGTFATQNIAATPALTMAGNISLGANYLSGDGGNEGVLVSAGGTVTVDQNTNATGLYIDSEATSATPLDIEADTITTGKVINIDNANALTTGSLAYLYSNSADTGTRNLVSIHNDNASATGATALQVRQDCATPPGLQVIGPNNTTGVAANQNGNDVVIDNAHNAGMSILSANANIGTIYFGDTDDVAKAYIQYSHSADDMNLVSGGSVLLSGNAGGQYRYALLTGDGYPVIYNAHSHSTTNYDRARTYWNSNVFTIATQSGGTLAGSNRNIAITPEGGLIGIGGTGASFPALKRSSTQLQVRLADDSAYAPLAAGDVTHNGHVNLAAVGTQLTIATGAITATKSYHRVDTEGDAASDDLDTINGGTEGDILVLRADDSTHDVVLRDGVGNLQLAGSNITLAHVNDTATLIFDGTNWLELSRSINS